MKDYEELLKKVAKHGTVFRVPDTNILNFIHPFLRHDVDFYLTGIEDMARLEKEYGHQAIYLFRLDAPTYNFFSEPCQALLLSLKELNHEVGLHIDRRNLLNNPQLEFMINDLVSNFSLGLDSNLKFMSWHRPLPSDLNTEQKIYLNLTSLYSNNFWHKDLYLSDSAGDWNTAKELSLLNFCASKKYFQLLIHPEWWQKSNRAESFAYSSSKHILSNFSQLKNEIRTFDELELQVLIIKYLNRLS